MRNGYRLLLVTITVLLSQGLWGQRTQGNIEPNFSTPNILVSPASFDFTAPVNGSASDVLNIENTGTSTLVWNVLEDDPALLLTDGRSLPVSFGRKRFSGGALSPLTAGLDRAIGGPDGFGYVFIDTNEPGGPVFDWTDISTIGTLVDLADDESATVALPFTFPFYGNSLTSIKISSNGYITFGTNSGTAPTNQAIPNPADPNGIIAGFWEDLDPSVGLGQIRRFHNVATNEFIVQFTNVQRSSSIAPPGENSSFTFQMILRPTGEILFKYFSMAGVTDGATVGIESPAGDTGLQVAFNSAYVADSLAVLFTPGVPWIAETPISGLILPGASQTVQIEVNAAGLVPGIYDANLLLNSNDADSPQIVIPVQFTVGPPEITVTPLALDFGTIELGGSATLNITVQNDGNLNLEVSETSIGGTNAGDFSIASGGAPFSVPGGGFQTVAVTFNPANAGAKSATLLIVSNDADEDSVLVTLSGTAVTPDIEVSPLVHDFGNVRVNTGATQPVTISNLGTSNLVVSALNLTGTNAGEFSFSGVTLPLNIAPGNSFAVPVTFTPATPGPKSAALDVVSNDLDEPMVSVSFSGSGVTPEIEVQPLALDFGDVTLGNTASQTVVIHNLGDFPLTVSGTALVGAHAAEFAITAGGAPFVLNPGENQTVTVTFIPLTVGPKTASMRITSDDDDESTVDVSLSGNALGVPDIRVEPLATDFGEVFLGDSAFATVRVINDGTADVTGIAGLVGDTTDFAITAGNSFTVMPGDTHQITLKFAPLTAGPLTSVLRITSNDPDPGENPVDVALTGVGITPEMIVEPLALDFGDVPVDTVSRAPVLVRNVGNAPLTVSSTAITGTNAANFVIVAGQAPFTVNPGDSQTVEIEFSPQTLGSKNATLTIISNDLTQGTVLVALSGNGVGQPEIGVSPAALDFGAVRIQTVQMQPLNISNSGNLPLVVTALALSGPDAAAFAVSPTDTLEIPPGGSQIVQVSFQPLTTGSKSAVLTIVNNDPLQPAVNIALSGVGIAPDITVTPTDFDFGNVLVGTVANTNFTVRNDGDDSLTVSSTLITGADAGAFAVLSGGAPFTLQPGQEQILTVAFLPGTTGLKSAILQVSSDDPDEPTVDAGLSGTGVQPEITVQPDSLGFGVVQVGDSTSKILEIRNDGTADLTVDSLRLAGVNVGEFTLVAPVTPLVLAPGGSTTAEVRFVPTSVGDKSAILSVFSNDSDENPVNVALTGTGTPIPVPDIEVVPLSLDFGNVAVEDTGTLSFDIINSGTAALAVTALNLGGVNTVEFALETIFLPAVLAPGDTVAVGVSFLPLTAGVKSASVEILNDDPDEPLVTVTLSGTAIPISKIALSADTIGFGQVTLGDSVTRSVGIANIGEADLLVTSVVLAGDTTGQFSLPADTAFVVAPGDTHFVEIQYTGLVPGIHTASLLVSSNDRDDPVVAVALNAETIAPDIAVSPAEIAFGGVAQNDSAAATLTITNAGTDTLQVLATTIAGDTTGQFRITTGFSGSIAPGDSQSVVVQFTALLPGVHAAQLNIASNDPDEPLLSVNLTATTLVPDIVVSPALVDFGKVAVSTADTAFVTVSNDSAAGQPLVVTSTEIVGDSAGAYALAGGGAPFTLAPGESRQLLIAFAPANIDTFRATLRIASNDPDENPRDVPLVGVGIIPLAHDFLFFGDFKVTFDRFLRSDGKVHSNVDISFREGIGGVHKGNVFASDDIDFRSNNTVQGSLFAGDEIDMRGGVVTGAVVPDTTIAPVPLPQLNFSAGGAIVFVDSGDTVELQPGSYNEVTVLKQGVLKLGAGEYFMNKFELKTQARLLANVGKGLVIVNVVNFMQFDQGTATIIEPDGDAGSMKLVFNSLQTITLDLRQNSRILGSIIAPNAKVELGNQSMLRGAICAHRIEFKQFAVALHHSSGEALPADSIALAKEIAESMAEVLPEKFDLRQNYPNPFNPSTTIEFSVALKPTDVRLVIYDITGRKVRTLVNEQMLPGRYSIVWDGANDHGMSVASGFYIYRMIAGPFVTARKMLLIR